MKLIERLIRLLTKRKPKNIVPEGNCPVCWGHQEYDGTLQIYFKDKQKDVNNHLDSYCRVQKFMKENFDGMPLKKPRVVDNAT